MNTEPQVLRTIESRTPVRADLAGGTLDIWPIFLLLDRAITINVGIDLFAVTRIEVLERGTGEKPFAQLVTEDQNLSLKLTWEEVETIQPPRQLVLHVLLLRHFLGVVRERAGAAPKDSIRITTKALSPAGAGLGGSSALNISLTGALHAWATGADSVDPLTEGERLIEISRDIETRVLHGPAGLQDYYGAMFGGLQRLEWRPGQHRQHAFPSTTLQSVDDRLLLFYSGKSRNSGINNWALFKSVIDREHDVHERFQEIAEATHQLNRALERSDWTDATRSIKAEWAIRRTLAKGISTPEIDEAFAKVQKIAPDAAFKICGAGGGGCFLVFLPEPNRSLKDEITASITGGSERPDAIRRLGFHCVPGGLEVKVRNG